MVLSTYDEMKPGQTELHEFLDNQPVDGPLNDSESYYTGQQRRWLAAWVRESADRMLLQHWTLRIWHEPPSDGAHADVRAPEGRVYASMRFDNAIFEESPADARNHLAHELSHVLLEGATQMVEYDLKGALSDQALALFTSAFHRQMEFAVDHLAHLLGPMLPMPPWAELDAAERTRHSNITAQDAWRDADQPAALGEPVTARTDDASDTAAQQ